MILQILDLHFNYPDEPIFSGLNLKIREGEKIAITGGSGSGKSTLFQLILGFILPEKGTIRYRGKPVEGSGIRELRTQTAWLPQDLNLGDGSVEEVVKFPFRFKIDGNKMPEKGQITEIFSDLGLEQTTLQKTFSDLSTGQRQRVGLALCILLQKPILLLDEPTSALDVASKERAAKHLFSNSGRTLLSISHDPWWIERCDRIIDLDNLT